MKQLEQLEQLKAEIETVQFESTRAVVNLQAKALEVFSELMETPAKAKALHAMVMGVNESRELTSLQHDEFFAQWFRVDFSELIDVNDEFQRDLLETYLDENHCVQVDYSNDCLTLSIGPAVLINDEGDVLDQDSQKWIISKKDYESDEERNSLIEKWMHEGGYFPSVISCDRHGNAFFANTQAKGA